MKLLTSEMFHNFHFQPTTFFSKKWKDKKISLRQISFDGPLPDTWFALDINTFDLFIYFKSFGTKNTPRLLKIGKMPKDYLVALSYICDIEPAMVRIITEMPYEELKKIKSGKEMKDTIKSFKF